MGISQCYSLTEGRLTFDLIEKVLPTGNSHIETQIVNEYREIKKLIYNKQIDNKEPYYISSKEKCLCDYIDINKRKDIFIKWAETIIVALKQQKPINLTQFIEEHLMAYRLKDNQRFIDLICLSPPKSLRWTTWMIIADIPSIRDKGVYNDYLNADIKKSTEDQIKKDLNRTFFINNSKEEQKTSLYNILRAFSNQDTEVSYCQGMNFITAFLLQSSNFDESDTFHLLSYVFSELRGFYSDSFPLLKSYLYVFNHFFEKCFPKLSKHFIQLEIPQELWIGKWIQTLYTICLPFDITQRLWDYLLSFGFEFIIPLSLSLVHHMEKKLLEFKDSSDVIEYFKEVFTPKEYVLYEKDVEDNVIVVDKVLVHAMKIYKTVSKSVMKNLMNEYEKKNNVCLDNMKKRYTMMNIKPMNTLSSASSDISYRKDNSNNSKSHLPSSVIVNKSDNTYQDIGNMDYSNSNTLIILNDDGDSNDCYEDEISDCIEEEIWFETNRSKMDTHVMPPNLKNKTKK